MAEGLWDVGIGSCLRRRVFGAVREPAAPSAASSLLGFRSRQTAAYAPAGLKRRFSGRGGPVRLSETVRSLLRAEQRYMFFSRVRGALAKEPRPPPSVLAIGVDTAE